MWLRFEGIGGADPCGNGESHAWEERRMNFKHIWGVLSPLLPTRRRLPLWGLALVTVAALWAFAAFT